MIITQKFLISQNHKTILYYNKNQKIIVFENNNKNLKYIKVPAYINVSKELFSTNVEEYLLTLKLNKNCFKKEFLIYCRKQYNFIQNLNKVYKKKLMLKGLGFKIELLEKNSTLSLKLGYSHLIFLKIPKNLSLYFSKKILIIEGYDLAAVGNFANNIRNLRFPDSYKEKGFWFKTENRILKEIKKT